MVVKGKTRPVTIFEVYQRDPPGERAAKARTRDLLQSGIEVLVHRDARPGAGMHSGLRRFTVAEGRPRTNSAEFA